MNETMASFQEQNNMSKAEKLVFRSETAGDILILGVWRGAKADISNRKERAGSLWAKVRGRLKKSRIPKRLQARVVQSFVKSGLLFDIAARSWQSSVTKSMQSWIDRHME